MKQAKLTLPSCLENQGMGERHKFEVREVCERILKTVGKNTERIDDNLSGSNMGHSVGIMGSIFKKYAN